MSDNFIAKIAHGGTSLVYSTYANVGQPASIAVDPHGAAYITGRTDGFIPDVNAWQSGYGGGDYDAYIIKMNPDGTALDYATYFGGSERDEGECIAVDTAGNMYLAGKTSSANLSVTNAFQPTYRLGEDGFFAKLDAAGTNLIFCSFLGVNYSDEVIGIAVDDDGMVYVAGSTSSTNFPVKEAIQPEKDPVYWYKTDAFVMQFQPDGSNLVYSTHWGGPKTEYCNGLALSPDGAVSIVGYTESSVSFPLYAEIQSDFGGGERDAFVARLPPIDIENANMGSGGITNGMIAISWFGEAGWRYDVEYSEDLSAPSSWMPLTGFTNILGVGATMNATDSVILVPKRSYRVKAQ